MSHREPPRGGDTDIVPGMGRGTRPPRRRRTLLVALVALLVVLVALVGVVVAVTASVTSEIPRIPDAFRDLDQAARPADSGATTFLLVGTDSRSSEPTTGADADPEANAGSQRSDVIMLATVQPDRTTGSVVSIPRDSWVEVPGRGLNKINAAYAFGGPSLLIQTVESYTGLRVDHFGVIDFAGFETLVDSVGGIEVNVAQATSNIGVQFRPGVNRLDGAQALAYVRQRYDLPNGDIDRARRQQNALRALLSTVQQQASSDPFALYRFATSIGSTVSVDDTLTDAGLARLAVDHRGLRSSGVSFLTAPVAGLGREGAQSVVYLDDDKAREMFGAIGNGSIARFVQLNPDQELGDTPS